MTDQQIFEILEKLVELHDKHDLEACQKVINVSRKNVEFTAWNICRDNMQRNYDFVTVHDKQRGPLWTLNGNVVSKYELIVFVENALEFWSEYVDDLCDITCLSKAKCDCGDCYLINAPQYDACEVGV